MSDDASARAQRQVIWLLWATYGAFYFCRVNIAAAVPGIEVEFELSKAQIGTILGGLKLAYGIGQLVNGQLSERIRPRILLAIGMFTSAGLKAVFGLATGMYLLLFVWAANGFFQALGWTPAMRVADPRRLRKGTSSAGKLGVKATAARCGVGIDGRHDCRGGATSGTMPEAIAASAARSSNMF